MKRGILSFGIIASSVAASLCCIGPLVFAGLGLGIFSAGAFFVSARPVFIALACGFLGAAYYYGRKEHECHDGICPVPRGTWRNRLFLWIVGALALGIITFPLWGGILI